MTDEEVEIVAEELAKVGGVSYRAISVASRPQDHGADRLCPANDGSTCDAVAIKPGATVIYRPPGDRRSYPCRVVEIKGSRAYLAPILRACTDWVSIEHLMPAEESEKVLAGE
jgi:hypothetical protein